MELVLTSGSRSILLEDLAALQLDMVLLNAGAERDGEAGAYRYHRLFEQEAALVGTSNRLGESRSIETLLTHHPVILPSQHSSIRGGFDALVARLNIEVRIAAEADDMAMLRLLAREDLGVAILPPVVVRDELRSGALIEADHLPGVYESFFAVTVERQFPNPLVRNLLSSEAKSDESWTAV